MSDLLGDRYSNLFEYKEADKGQQSKVGYGLGGVKGMKNLASTLTQRVKM